MPGGKLPPEAFDFYVGLGRGRSYVAVAKEYDVSKRAVAKKAKAEEWQARLAKVMREGYVDSSAFDPDSRYFDPKSDPENPAWCMVDIDFVTKLEQPVSRESMMSEPCLEEMMLLRRGARLSVQPVTKSEWDHILQMAGIKPW